jgi:hypothetical protein
VQHLERDLAIELGIVGSMDDTHAAGAEFVEHHVASDRGAALEGSSRPWAAYRRVPGIGIDRQRVVVGRHERRLGRDRVLRRFHAAILLQAALLSRSVSRGYQIVSHLRFRFEHIGVVDEFPAHIRERLRSRHARTRDDDAVG